MRCSDRAKDGENMMIKGMVLAGVDPVYVLVKVLDIRAYVFWFRYLIMFMRFSHSVALSSQTIAMSHDRFAPKTEFVLYHVQIN